MAFDWSARSGQHPVLNHRAQSSILLTQNLAALCTSGDGLDLETSCGGLCSCTELLYIYTDENLLSEGAPANVILTAPSVSHTALSHLSNDSKNSAAAASPSPRSTRRFAPCSPSTRSMSVGIRWYVFTQSLFPHPNTAYLMPEKAASWTFSSHSTKCLALSAGWPSKEAVTIRMGPSCGRCSVAESSVPRDARNPEHGSTTAC